MRRLAKWVGMIALALMALVAIFAILVPSVFSTRLAIVYSGSMEPALPAGSLAVSQPVDPTTIQVGDIIAFDPPWDPRAGVIVSHRVIGVIDDDSLGFITKGDANEDPDPLPVYVNNVKSKVLFHIAYVGYPLVAIRQFASSIWGFGLLIVLPALIIFGSAARDLNLKYNPGKRRDRILKRRENRLKKRGHRYHRR